MPATSTDKFIETLDLWKRRAIAVFALLSLLLAMFVALVVEFGAVIEVATLKLGIEKVSANSAARHKGATHCLCSCKATKQ